MLDARGDLTGAVPARAIRSALVVDDDETILAACRRAAGREVVVVTASTGEHALEIARRDALDLAVIDLRLGNESGIDLVRTLKAERPQLVIAMCSAYLSVVAAVAAVRAGADMVLFKPITFREILRRVEANPVVPDPGETPTLARIEWEHITRVLSDCNGNVSMAARRLGIYRSSLQRRLRKHAPRE